MMTPAPTGARTAPGPLVGRAVAAAAVVVGLGLCLAAPAGAGLGDPLGGGRGDATTTTEREAPSTTTTTAAQAPTSTKADGDAPATTAPRGASSAAADGDDGDGDGTSAAALGAVGVVAFLVGLVVAGVPLLIALSRRKGAPAAAPAVPVTTPVAPAPAPAPAPAGPAIGAPPARDADQVRSQRVGLVQALIVLRDKLPSEALQAEVTESLARAGVTELAPVGQPFDPVQHKAVHQEATDDPARHGTITAVERPGYADGTVVIRQPEVVVAVHGASS